MTIDVRDLIQTALDGALSADKVRVFWQRKTDTAGAKAGEYVVYTVGGDQADYFADDEPLVRSTNVTVRYFYDFAWLDSPGGRAAIRDREKQILAVLQNTGFSVSGPFDAGDIDDIGFGVSIFEADYSKVV